MVRLVCYGGLNPKDDGASQLPWNDVRLTFVHVLFAGRFALAPGDVAVMYATVEEAIQDQVVGGIEKRGAGRVSALFLCCSCVVGGTCLFLSLSLFSCLSQ